MTKDHQDQASPIKSESSDSSRVKAVTDYCRDLVAHIGFRLDVHSKEQDGKILINLSGVDRSLLLAGSASVLNSIEYLLNKSFRTGRHGDIASIIADSDDFRKHREAELVLLAKMAAEKVISQRRPLELQPMTPKERRIVHLALSEIDGVRSESSGEGENRSITISLSE